jgi:hypothetical protein
VTCGIGVNAILYAAPTKLLRDLRALVGAIPDGTVILDLPLPAGLWGILGRISAPYVARINRTIHETAQARELPVAEVSAHFMPPWGGKFAPDYFHPSQAGYGIGPARCWLPSRQWRGRGSRAAPDPRSPRRSGRCPRARARSR